MLDRQSSTLPSHLAARGSEAVADWQQSGKIRRLWARDSSLWTGADEKDWLGWLNVTDDQLAHIGPVKDIARKVMDSGVQHVVLLGTGGSSLGAEVLRQTFGTTKGVPELHVLDSTDPAQIAATERAVDAGRASPVGGLLSRSARCL